MANKTRRQFSREFKLQVIREIEAGKTVAQAAREHQLRPNLIGRWQKQHGEYGERSFAGAGHSYTESAKIAELERKVGQLTMEADLLKKALLRFETRARSAAVSGRL